MPTVTSSRVTPGMREYKYTDKYGRYTYDIFAADVSFSGKPPPAMQTTTSFRTGKRSAGDGVQDDVLMSGGNWAQATRSATRNPWTSRGAKHDTGHPFHTSKAWYSGLSHPNWEGRYVWKGPLIPWCSGYNDVRNLSVMGNFVPTQPSLAVQGVKAIRDTLPTKSPAGLAQALIELKREGLPRVSRSIDGLLGASDARSIGSSVGGAHLTSEFGVKPLLRDFEDALRVIKNGEEILAKYEDGVGKRQHRQRTFEPRVYSKTDRIEGSSARVADFHNGGAYFMNLDSEQGSHMLIERVVSYTDYFKGAYMYHLPKMNHSSDVVQFMENYSYLTGMEPSVSLLWEVTPWSWLSDWVINIGDNIAVAESLRSDGLVLLYGYMMRTTRYHATSTLYGVTSNGGDVGPVTLSYDQVIKERQRATPYGFGLNTGGFTKRQWAILGALGLTKGNNSLRLSD